MKLFQKKISKNLDGSKKVRTFAPANRKTDGSVAQLNRASDYGSEGCGFESRRNHERESETSKEVSDSSFCLFTG